MLVLPSVTQGGSVRGASWIWESISREIQSGTWLVTLVFPPSPFVSTTDSPSRFSLWDNPLLCPLYSLTLIHYDGIYHALFTSVSSVIWLTEALSYLISDYFRRPQIPTESDVMNQILKSNCTGRMRSYLEAGCRLHCQNISNINQCELYSLISEKPILLFYANNWYDLLI